MHSTLIGSIQLGLFPAFNACGSAAFLWERAGACVGQSNGTDECPLPHDDQSKRLGSKSSACVLAPAYPQLTVTGRRSTALARPASPGSRRSAHATLRHPTASRAAAARHRPRPLPVHGPPRVDAGFHIAAEVLAGKEGVVRCEGPLVAIAIAGVVDVQRQCALLR